MHSSNTFITRLAYITM